MTSQRISNTRVRLPIALAAAAAAIGTAAVLPTTGSAQTSSTTLHLLAKNQKHVGFLPRHHPRQGDRLGFGDKISGDDTGIDRGVCTFIGGKLLCNVQAQLSKGGISLQGLLPRRFHDTPIAVTGGTGAYDGVRGTAFLTTVNHNHTRIRVVLVQ